MEKENPDTASWSRHKLLEININAGKPAEARKHLSKNRPLSVKCNTMDCTVYRAWFVGKDLRNHDSFDICIQMTKLLEININSGKQAQARKHLSNNRPLSVKCNTMDCTVYRAWFVGKDLRNHDSFDICIQMTKNALPVEKPELSQTVLVYMESYGNPSPAMEFNEGAQGCTGNAFM
ncbi:UNVERIFIED_CONTAM: hypothetical protein FKN15_065657 [Acipenser sinensis]